MAIPLYDENKKNTLFQRSADTDLLIKMFEETSEGDLITYDEMTKALGRDVRKRCYSNMLSARKIVLNEHGIVFSCIPKVGLKRIGDEEKVESSKSFSLAIRRRAQAGAKVLTSVNNFDQLPKEKQIEHNLRLSLFGLLIEGMKAKNIKKLEAKVADTGQRLPVGKTSQCLFST